MENKKDITVGATDWAIVDKELTPILAELVTLEPNNEDHPAVTQLFEWLVNPQRTGQEYAYVLGKLADEVYCVMLQHFQDYMYNESCFPYLCTTAAEALAKRCPILQDGWEEAAWTLLVTTQWKQPYEGTTECDMSVSDHVRAWIIQVITDSDLCPNCYLRLALLELLMRMVHVNECNFTQVIEAILSVCSDINIDYIIDSPQKGEINHALQSFFSTHTSMNIDYLKTNLKKYEGVALNDITVFLGKLDTKAQLLEFDQNLAKKMHDMQSLRCSAVIHDVTYLSARNTTIYSVPREFHGLLNMIKYANRSIQGLYKGTLLENYSKQAILLIIKMMCDALFTIITIFNNTCQTPQLFELTSICIMDLVELAIKINEEIDEEDELDQYLLIFNQLGLQKMNDLLTYFVLGYDGQPLPMRPIRLSVINDTLIAMLNDYKWNVLVCNDIFYSYFDHSIVMGNGVQYVNNADVS